MMSAKAFEICGFGRKTGDFGQKTGKKADFEPKIGVCTDLTKKYLVIQNALYDVVLPRQLPTDHKILRLNISIN